MLFVFLSAIEAESDKRSFEEIYMGYRKQMFCLANSVLKNEQDAEDAVQNALFGIARNMETVAGIQNDADLRNYVLKSAKNAALNLLKSKKQRKETVLVWDIAEDEELSDALFLDTVCAHAAYEEAVAAIRQLDEIYRDALYNYFVLELSVSEIARLTETKSETVRKRILRGKNILLEKLSAKGVR